MRRAIQQVGKGKAGEYLCSNMIRQIMGWQNITAGGSRGSVWLKSLNGIVGMKGGSLLYLRLASKVRMGI